MVEMKRYNNKKSLNNEAPLYIGLSAVIAEMKGYNNKKVRIILNCWKLKLLEYTLSYI